MNFLFVFAITNIFSYDAQPKHEYGEINNIRPNGKVLTGIIFLKSNVAIYI